MNCVELDMAVSSFLDLANECRSLSLASDQKAIIADNCSFLAKAVGKGKPAKGDDPKPLLSFLADPDPRILLFLLVSADALDENSPFYEALAKGGAKITAVNVFTPEQWRSFLTSFFAKRGAAIEPEAAEELLKRIEGDYGAFLNEAPKLLAYANGEAITKEMVSNLVAAPLETDAFQLSNALMRGDKAQAIAIYHDLSMRAVDPVPLINLLGRQFLFMDQLAYLSEKGLGSGAIASELACSVGRVNASLYSLRRMKSGSIGRALEGLYEASLRIMTGEWEPDLAFSLFLADFSL